MEARIEKEATYYGLKYDIDIREVTDEQVSISDRYSSIYCKAGKCQFNYACCRNCTYLEKSGCREDPVPDCCRVFFCSPIIKKMRVEDRRVLDLDFLI